MTRINTNTASLRGLNALNRSNKSLNQSLTRLTTGLKINSGQDNPAGLIASETLRSQIAAIEQSITNSNRASNVIATADAALGEVSSLLIQVRGLIQEGINDGALSTDEKEANQLQIDSALSAINRISSNTTFGGDKLIDGSKSFTTTTTTANAAKLNDFQINEASFGSSSSLEINARIESKAEQAELVFSSYLSEDTTLEVGGSGGTELVFLGEAATIADVSTAINGVSDATGVSSKVQQTGVNQGAVVTVNAAADNDNRFLVRETSDSDLVVKFEVEAVDDGPESVTVDDSVDGEVTIKLSVDSNANTTLNDALDLINDNADANQYVEAVLLHGSGATAFVATDDIAEAQLENGTNTRVTFGDETLTVGFTGDQTVNVVFEQGAAGVVVADDTTTTGEITITVTNDFNSGLTLDTLISQIEGDAEADALLQLSTDGDKTTSITSAPSAIDSGAASATKIADTITLFSNKYGSDEFVSVSALSGSFTTTASAGSTAVVTRDEGTDVVAFINGQRAESRGLRASIKTSALDASLTFQEAANTDDNTAAVTVTGGGATFQIGQEATTSGQITIGIGPVNTARLGGTSGKLYELASTGGKSLLDVGPDTPGSTLVGIVEEAINEVSTLRGRLGALQKNVIETNISSLGVALESISEARSAITDTDFAEETAALTRAQILQQAGFSSLGIANQSPQNVLSLLG